MEKKELSEREKKWIRKLQAYDFNIEYVKGKKNIVGCALSSIPPTFLLIEATKDWKSLLLVGYSKNKFAYEIM